MTCRICNSPVQKYLHKNGYDILRCVRCGFGQVSVTAAEISAFYDKAYFGGEKANFAQEEDSEISPSYRYWIDRQLDRLPASGTVRVLEIGPGLGGPIAGYIQRQHPRVEFSCIEISKYASERLVARGFTVHCGGVSDAAAVEGWRSNFDLIYGTEVIEHDPDPRAFVRTVHDMLKPGRWAAFTTGNLDGLMARWKRESWYYIDPPAHVSYYTPKAVRHAFGTEGFDQVRAMRYGFRHIDAKLKTHLPGLLVLTHLANTATGINITARRSL
jgi:SAM-dependent methyltransferase